MSGSVRGQHENFQLVNSPSGGLQTLVRAIRNCLSVDMLHALAWEVTSHQKRKSRAFVLFLFFLICMLCITLFSARMQIAPTGVWKTWGNCSQIKSLLKKANANYCIDSQGRTDISTASCWMTLSIWHSRSGDALSLKEINRNTSFGLDSVMTIWYYSSSGCLGIQIWNTGKFPWCTFFRGNGKFSTTFAWKWIFYNLNISFVQLFADLSHIPAHYLPPPSSEWLRRK